MTMTTSSDRTGANAGVPAEWLDPHLPTVFSRWHGHVAHLQQASVDAIIAAASVGAGDMVLDVGSGSGIPALALAAAVGPTGRMVATDPSPVFVAALHENAHRLGLANLEVVQASAETLPFMEGGFDAATCHMGAMFFADLPAGLARIREVLKPGGRAAFVAWGPDEENAFFGSFWAAVHSIQPPDAPASNGAPDPDTPRPGRFARPGSLSAALQAAGFEDVREASRVVDLVWPGDAESMTNFWFELTRIEGAMPAERLPALRGAVLATMRRFADGAATTFSAPIVVTSGRA